LRKKFWLEIIKTRLKVDVKNKMREDEKTVKEALALLKES